MSSSVERSGSFERVRHRESVDTIVEDASPTNVAKKHPWKKDGTSPRRNKFIKEEKRSRKLPEQSSPSRILNGSPSSPVSSTIVRGTWKEPQHPSDSDDHSHPIIETQSSVNSPEREHDTTSRSRRSKKSKDSDRNNGEVDQMKRPARIKTSPLLTDVTVEPTDSRDYVSSALSGPDSTIRSRSSLDSMSSPTASPVHLVRNDQDEALAHLVQMVESTDMTDNGGHVPFVDPESKDSLSEYSIVDDTPVAFFQSANSGYSAEYEDFDVSHDAFFQSAILSSEEFSALEYDGNRGPMQQLSGGEELTDLTVGDATEVASRNFAMEHRIFMKAALELLTQRERYAADIDMNDKDTIKSGPLKKASHLVRGIWKVKYVEVRRGVFSYYEDESKDSEAGTLVRKNIPLHATTCSCRAVKIQHKALSVNPGGALFELKIEGGSKRLWMANSREERQAWIEAIHTATLGRSVTRGESDIDHHAGKSGTVSEESPYRAELELYVNVQRGISRALSREQYLRALSGLVGKKLNVPVQWIRRQMGGIEHANRAFHEEAVSRGVDQLWKDLLRDSVRIDDEVFIGGSGNAPERIIAALMRCIMGSDRSSPLSVNASVSQKNKYFISESQSLSYARDILLAGNRTRSGGDSYYCVSTLCKNPEQVVTVPSSLEAEPWQISISHIQPEKRGRGDTYYSLNELSGWLKTRSKPQKNWKKRYFVLSEGVLSYFEKALPRPRGLRGQISLVEAAINVGKESKQSDNRRRSSSSSDPDNDASSKHFLVSILGKDGKLDRQILFEDEKKFIIWTHSLEAYCVDDELWQSNHSVSLVSGMFRKLREELTGTQDLYGNFVLGHKSLKDNADELGLDSEEVNTCIANASKSGANGRATVLVSVEAATDYRVCTLDPQGDEKEDTWA